jgi:hypothetical protein
MRKYTKTIFLLLFVLIGCSSNINTDEFSKADTLAMHIQGTVAKKMTEKYHMFCVGFSARMPENVINNLGLSFQIHRKLSKEEAREILLDCVHTFLTAVNTNEEIRPFLKNDPFTPSNISISIFIQGRNGQDIFDPDLGIVHAMNGFLDYGTYEKGTKIPKIQSKVKETYEEAVERANPH